MLSCVWSSFLIPPPPQAHEARVSYFSMYATDHIKSFGVIMALYLSYTLAEQTLPVHLKLLKSLFLTSVSLAEGVEDAVVDSPTFIHFTSSFIVVIWLPS